MTGRRAPLWWRRSRLGALSAVGLVLLVALVLLALLGPLLPFGNPSAIGAGGRLELPDAHFIAGTDTLGRSVLPRLLEGLRTTLLVAGVAVLATAVFSILLGMTAAYFGGLANELIARGADVLFAFPSVLLSILIVAITGPGLLGVTVAIVLTTSPLMIRVMRAATLGIVSRDFVLTAQVGGAGLPRLLFVHILPNVAGTAAVQATYALSVGMLVESALSFLGLGVQPPQASLGSLVYEGSSYLSVAPWLVIIPGVVLAVTILSVNLTGDWLRDLLDVRAGEVRR
jgi:peptide/nickel transport system permease protein